MSQNTLVYCVLYIIIITLHLEFAGGLLLFLFLRMYHTHAQDAKHTLAFIGECKAEENNAIQYIRLYRYVFLVHSITLYMHTNPHFNEFN